MLVGEQLLEPLFQDNELRIETGRIEETEEADDPLRVEDDQSGADPSKLRAPRAPPPRALVKLPRIASAEDRFDAR